ncbi:MAG: lipoyl(octanoyl) transferase LipB [Candidatus Omnitrophota bacterium]
MDLKTFDLGLSDYESSLKFQKEIFNKVRSKLLPSSLIINRHNPVITLGRLTDKNNILAGKELLDNKNIRVLQTERGGDVTYHGPGQLTVYPIFDLKYLTKDVHLFIRFLEQAVIDFLSGMDVSAHRINGRSGVWVENKKIASVGISIRQWITFHGISLNITRHDLDNFKLIRPCGMDVEMTCLESELNRAISVDELKDGFVEQFKLTLESFYCSPTGTVPAEAIDFCLRGLSLYNQEAT